MPKLYFCQPPSQGILRAVLSSEQSKQVISTSMCCYLGDRFPVSSDQTQGSPEFAVLRIEKEESSRQWRAGFYRVDRSLTELNEALLQLSL